MLYLFHVAAHAAVALFLAAVILWIRRSTSGSSARWMVLLLALDVVWVLVILGQLLAPVALKKWLAPVAAGLGVVVTVPWFIFALHYTGRQQLLTPVRNAALWGGAVVIFLALATTNVHSLLWTGFEVVEDPFVYVVPQMEPVVALIYLLTYGLVVASIVVLVDFLLSTRHLSRTQTVTLTVGVTVALTINVLSALDMGLAAGFDYTGLSTGLFGAIVGWSLFNDRLFRVAPVARDTIFESFSDPLIAVDVDTSIVDYNTAAARVFPDIDAAVGDSVSTLEPALVDTGGDGEFADELVRTVDGSARSFRIEQSAIEAGDREVGTVVHLRDVTELEAYAAELERRTDQLETKTTQLEEFASSVSHDLRNPINVAKGRIDVAKQTGDDEHLDTASEALDRGLETIEELLDLARSGQRISEKEAVDIATVVDYAWSAVDTRDGTLTVEADDVVVMADRGRLQGLFENLFRNAIDHVGDDVHVTVGVTADGFTVGDDGPGIPEEARETVFEHGYTGADGTGLGLAKVESIAIAHDWSVSVGESDAGGAQFVFENVEFGSETA